MLRWIRATVRQREGRLVTYAELAKRLRAELQTEAEDEAQIERARQELLEALRAARLTAWGKPNTRQGQPNPLAQFEAIPASVFIDEAVSITEWATVSADPNHPTAIYSYHGPTFREVRFHSAEVLTVWPAEPPETAISNHLADAAPRTRGGRPVQHDWDAFWIQVAMFAAENGLYAEERTKLQRHMQDWTAQHWPEISDPATIRARIRRLFDTIRGKPQ
jgi:hypothetical protein